METFVDIIYLFKQFGQRQEKPVENINEHLLLKKLFGICFMHIFDAKA